MMVEVQMYTVRELLFTPAMMGRIGRLAESLHIHRSTVRKFFNDIDNTSHSILRINGKYVFMSVTLPHKMGKI